MLKLEKNSRSQDITICLLDRERFFNRTMLLAIGIAFTLHFSAAQLFQIKLFHFNHQAGILSSTMVESHLEYIGGSRAHIISQIEEKKVPKKTILEPVTTYPFIPTLNFSALQKNVYSNDMNSLTSELATQNNEYTSIRTQQQPTSVFLPIEIRLIGPLASKRLLNDGMHVIHLDTIIESVSFLYRIQVEGSTGTIFWYEQSFENVSLLKSLAEQILANMAFEPDEQGFIYTSEIEIILKNTKNTL